MRAGTLALPGGTLETAWWGPGPSDAPTLVLLHEGLGCVGLWRDVPGRLAAATGWGVFAYSRFGYGRSGPTPLPRPMTYMQHEALTILPNVLAEAGIRQAALLGHSDGGSIAAVYAGMDGKEQFRPPPGRVMAGEGRPPTASGAILDTVAGGARGVTEASVQAADRVLGPLPQLLGLITIAAHFFVEDLNIASIRRIKQDYDAGDLRPRLARYHRDVDMAFRGWNDAWLDPRFRDFDITGFLPGIRVPILALQGAGDPYGTDEQLRVMRARVQVPIDVKLIPGARHAPHLEAREATLSAATQFITGLKRRDPA